MGYSNTQKEFRLYDISLDIFFVSRDVTFREDIFPFKHPKSTFLAPHSIHHSSTFPPALAYPYPLNDDLPFTLTTTDPITPTTSSPEPFLISDSSPNTTDTGDTPSSSSTDQLLPCRKSIRTVKPSIWHTDYITKSTTYHPVSHCLSYSHISPSYKAYLTAFSSSIF